MWSIELRIAAGAGVNSFGVVIKLRSSPLAPRELGAEWSQSRREDTIMRFHGSSIFH
jgi:hypothetical protein